MTEIWESSELGRKVLEHLAKAEHEVVIIAPFITGTALDPLMGSLPPGIGLTVVTDMCPLHAATGALDVAAIRRILERETGALRRLSRLHAKLYMRDWTSVWVGSANFTGAGLGLSSPANHELLGFYEEAGQGLVESTRRILFRSQVVSEEEVESFEQQALSWRSGTVAMVSELGWEWPSDERSAGRIMLADLPMLSSPLDLAQCRADSIEARHDLFLLGLKLPVQEEHIREACVTRMLEVPAFRELDRFVQQPRRFGEIAAWLHEACEDRPVPYRSDVKKALARAISWLSYGFVGRYRQAQPGHTTWFGWADGDWSGLSTKGRAGSARS